jgi:RNase H-like domain found in reverse transcriptase
MDFPHLDRKYTLIMNAATLTADSVGDLGAILMQIDSHDNFYTISFASRQLKDHKNNYSPFLLEAVAAVWGMDVFNKYLKGKQLILYTDHKPVEKMGHLHTNMMNHLQAAMLGHNFVIQYKKGTSMLADYLSRLPSDQLAPIIATFDPFKTDLVDLQHQDSQLQLFNNF